MSSTSHTNLSYSESEGTGAANAAYTLERLLVTLVLYDGGPGVNPTGEGLWISGGGRWLRCRPREVNVRFEVDEAVPPSALWPEELAPTPRWERVFCACDLRAPVRRRAEGCGTARSPVLALELSLGPTGE